MALAQGMAQDEPQVQGSSPHAALQHVLRTSDGTLTSGLFHSNEVQQQLLCRPCHEPLEKLGTKFPAVWVDGDSTTFTPNWEYLVCDAVHLCDLK
jgi:hypothetical protein